LESGEEGVIELGGKLPINGAGSHWLRAIQLRTGTRQALDAFKNRPPAKLVSIRLKTLRKLLR